MPSSRVLVPLRWGDQDAYGHVNNVAVARLLEEARARGIWRPSAGVLPPLDPAQPVWWLVTELNIRYREILDYSAEAVEVDMEIQRVGGASFTIGYEIATERGTRRHASAMTTIALVDRDTSSVRRLTADQRSYLHGLASADPAGP